MSNRQIKTLIDSLRKLGVSHYEDGQVKISFFGPGEQKKSELDIDAVVSKFQTKEAKDAYNSFQNTLTFGHAKEF